MRLFSGFIFIVGLCFAVFCRFVRPDRWFSISETVSLFAAATVFMLLSIQSFATLKSPDLLKVMNRSGVDKVAHFAFTEAIGNQGGIYMEREAAIYL